MVRAYGKNLRKMLRSNLLRLGAISLIIAIGVALTTGIGSVALQIRDALKTDGLALELETVFLISGIADKIELIGNVLPPFFIFITTLTALTTLTRLVDEERPVFACYKTLGYPDRLIVVRYVIFAFICVVAGCFMGLCLGNYLLRPFIYNAVLLKFDLPGVRGLYLAQGIIWSVVTGAAVILTALIIGLLKCRECPAAMLRPKAPKAGKKILPEYLPFIWKRLKFKFKSAVRNIFRFKGRLIMTVFSVAGATIMLFVGLGLMSSVNSPQNESMQGVAGFTDSMSAIAAIITVCGVALAVLVLFNLTNINIEERRREIATLKVLGYNPFEVAGFIYRELMILSVLGILIGLPAGYYFDGFLFDYLDFGSLELIEWFVWVGVTLTALLAVILADLLLYRKISKIDPLTSLKTVE